MLKTSVLGTLIAIFIAGVQSQGQPNFIEFQNAPVEPEPFLPGDPDWLKAILGSTVLGRPAIGGQDGFMEHGGAGRGEGFNNGLRNGWDGNPSGSGVDDSWLTRAEVARLGGAGQHMFELPPQAMAATPVGVPINPVNTAAFPDVSSLIQEPIILPPQTPWQPALPGQSVVSNVPVGNPVGVPVLPQWDQSHNIQKSVDQAAAAVQSQIASVAQHAAGGLLGLITQTASSYGQRRDPRLQGAAVATHIQAKALSQQAPHILPKKPVIEPLPVGQVHFGQASPVAEHMQAKTIDQQISHLNVKAATQQINQGVIPGSVVNPIHAKPVFIDTPVPGHMQAKALDQQISGHMQAKAVEQQISSHVQAKSMQPQVVGHMQAKAVDQHMQAKSGVLPVNPAVLTNQIVNPVPVRSGYGAQSVPAVANHMQAKAVDQHIQAKAVDQHIQAKAIDQHISHLNAKAATQQINQGVIPGSMVNPVHAKPVFIDTPVPGHMQGKALDQQISGHMQAKAVEQQISSHLQAKSMQPQFVGHMQAKAVDQHIQAKAGVLPVHPGVLPNPVVNTVPVHSSYGRTRPGVAVHEPSVVGHMQAKAVDQQIAGHMQAKAVNQLIAGHMQAKAVNQQIAGHMQAKAVDQHMQAKTGVLPMNTGVIMTNAVVDPVPVRSGYGRSRPGASVHVPSVPGHMQAKVVDQQIARHVQAKAVEQHIQAKSMNPIVTGQIQSNALDQQIAGHMQAKAVDQHMQAKALNPQVAGHMQAKAVDQQIAGHMQAKAVDQQIAGHMQAKAVDQQITGHMQAKVLGQVNPVVSHRTRSRMLTNGRY